MSLPIGVMLKKVGTMKERNLDELMARHHILVAIVCDLVTVTKSEIGNRDCLDSDHIVRTHFDDIAASTEETLVLYDLAQSLTGPLELPDAADVISKHIRRLVPASTCVFYVYDEQLDELYAAHAAGDHASQFSGVRIPRGQRLTGWVAANKRTILNSDPVLDLGEAGRAMRPRLYSCLSTPLVSDAALVGVLTLYSAQHKQYPQP